LEILGADFSVGESAGQDVTLLLMSVKGQWKQFPVIGADIVKYLNNSGSPDAISSMLSEVQNQLELIGYGSANVSYEDGELIIEN